MSFAKRLKEVRKENGMSQELLAEKLGVSRQAVTKWETEKGMPDIENLIVISNLFGITVDELLSNEKETSVRKGYLFESRTEYDIDGKKRFDIKLGGAAVLKVNGTEDEKIVVHLKSNELSGLKEDLKVKIDDIKGRIDVEVKRKNSLTEAKTKELLFIEVFLPNKYLSHVELECNCGEVIFSNLVCEEIEFGGKAPKCRVDSMEGELEIDCNIDMDVLVEHLEGALAINQVLSTSKLTVPDNFDFKTVVKGIKTLVTYENEGEMVEDFSNKDAENVIEFNGLMSELIINSRVN